MSSESHSSDSSEYSDDSEWNYIPGVYNIESKNQTAAADICFDEEEFSGPYADEPLAEQDWLLEYNKRQKEKEERLKSLERRFSGVEANWCSCGHCCTDLSQNPNECYCCMDLDKTSEALSSLWVLNEVREPPPCITLHPGFTTVCLDKWSLRMAAAKYRTIDKKTYKQTGSENSFLRSVAYREYIFLVHGRIGKTRLPLPACAYHRIRSTFKSEDDFIGFQEDDNE